MSSGPAVVTGATLVCAVACLVASRRRPRRVAAFLHLAALGAACWGAGALVWGLEPTGSAAAPVPHVTDALWVLASLVGAVSFLRWPGVGTDRLSVLRVVCDSLTVVASVLLLVWPSWLDPVLAADLPPSTRSSLVVYPFVDLSLAAALTVLASSARGVGRAYAVLGAVFATSLATADFTVSLAAVHGVPTPGAAFAAYTLAWLALAGAALLLGVENGQRELPRLVGVADVLLVLAVVVGAGVGSALTFVRGRPVRTPELVLIGLVVLGACARQVAVALAQRAAAGALADLAFVDPGTGLPNRAALLRVVDERRDLGARRSIVLVGLDGLGAVNEIYGHETGDRLLSSVGRRLGELLGEEAFVARATGDEFAVLVPGGEAEVDALAEQVRSALTGHAALGVRSVPVSVSIGVGPVPDLAEGVHPLRWADLALRQAKTAGRGRVVRFSADLAFSAIRRQTMDTELREAVARQQVDVAFQPIVRLQDRDRVVGFEALARWTSPTLGPVPPDRFVPAAERLGLIGDLGRVVLDRACEVASRWCAGGSPAYVAVNVSVIQLEEPGLVEHVLMTLQRHRLPAAHLVLEVTESVFARDSEHLATTLEVLRTAGVRVALDDFGTGYSSLAYLRQLPVDVLKLDASFTRGAAGDRWLATLTEGVVDLGRRLGTQVVAEGVELTAEADLLRRIGCPLAQGFHFAEPMGADEATALVLAQETAAVPSAGAGAVG